LAARKMSKKNNLAKRKKQHEFDLQSTTDRSYIRLLPCRFSSHLLVDFTNQASDLGLWWLSCMCVCAGEKEAKEKLAKKLQAKKSKMKVLSTSSTSPFLSMDESFVV
jgi:hypothetical protein